MVARLVKPGEKILLTLSAAKINLWHAALGIGTEAGELGDAVKKYLIYEKDLDLENILEELGDMEFYLQQFRAELGVTREETLQHNLHKLSDRDKGRYASGYSNEAAIARIDKTKKQP